MNYVQRQLLGMSIWAFLAFASLLTVAYLTSLKREDAGDFEHLLPKLIEREPSQLVLIRGNEEVTFAKSDPHDAWFAQAPLNERADSHAIEGIIAALRDVRVIRRVRISWADTDNVREIGVQTPRFAWRVSLDHQEWTLKFGTQAQGAAQGTYVALIGPVQKEPAVYVVDARTTSLDVQPEQLLDSRLIQVRAADVREFAVDSPTTKIHGRQDPRTGHWFAADSPHVRLNPERTAALFSGLSSLRANPKKLAPRGASNARPRATIKLVQAEESSIDLLDSCSEDQGFLWTRIRDARTRNVCVDASRLEQVLLGDAESWLDTRLFTLRVDEVETIAYKIGRQTISVARDGSEFAVTGLEPTRLSLEIGNDYLSELLSARGEIIRAPEALSFPDSGEYIEISSSTAAHERGTVVEKLILGTANGDGGRLVKRAEDATVLVVSRAVAEVLQMGTSLRARRDSFP